MAGSGSGQKFTRCVPARFVDLRRLAQWAGSAQQHRGRCAALFLQPARPHQSHHGQPPPDRAQALLPLGAARRRDADRPHAQIASGQASPACAQDIERIPGRGLAGRARHRNAVGPARPHHAGVDVRQRLARERAGGPVAAQRGAERQRAAHSGQRLQRTAGALWRSRRAVAHALPRRRPRCAAGRAPKQRFIHHHQRRARR